MINQGINNIVADDDSVESIDFVINENSESIKKLAKELSAANREFTDDSKANSFEKEPPRSTSIKITSLPKEIQSIALGLDKNNDGDLSLGELAFAIDDLENKRRSNKNLKRTIAGFLVLVVAMIACIFAASLTAARLSKDFNVNSNSGLAIVKGPAEPVVMKTHSAIFYNDKVSIGELSNEDLGNLKEVILKGGDLKVIVKGYSRDPFDEEQKVIILVEGGTMTYDNAGIVAATGNAKMALEALYGTDIFEEDGRTRRLTGLTHSVKGGFDSISNKI